MDSHFGLRFVGVWCRLCHADVQLNVRKASVSVFGDDPGVAEDQWPQASTVSSWPPRSVHNKPFSYSSLASHKSGDHFPVHADSGKQNEQAPMMTRGCFWESWAPSLLADSSLEREAVSSQPKPQSVHVLHVDRFSWVFVELVGDMLGRAVFVTKNDVFLGDMGVHSRADGSRVRL